MVISLSTCQKLPIKRNSSFGSFNYSLFDQKSPVHPVPVAAGGDRVVTTFVAYMASLRRISSSWRSKTLFTCFTDVNIHGKNMLGITMIVNQTSPFDIFRKERAFSPGWLHQLELY